jgi:hypothetical protein
MWSVKSSFTAHRQPRRRDAVIPGPFEYERGVKVPGIDNDKPVKAVAGRSLSRWLVLSAPASGKRQREREYDNGVDVMKCGDCCHGFFSCE